MLAENAIDFHSNIASEFAEKYNSSRAFRERFQVWTDLLDRYVSPTDEVMDLGCGSGIFSPYLADKGCVVTGIDGSAAMIRLCEQRNPLASVRYIVQALPLTDLTAYQPQDVVLMSSLLEYIDDRMEMLKQARHLLKPNGLLLVSIPNRTSLYRQIERMLFRLTGRPAYIAHVRHMTTETSFNRQLEKLGFDTLETIYYAGQDPVSTLLKPFLAGRYVNNLLVGVYRKRTE